MIELEIKKTVILSDIWCDKEAWDDVFKDNLPAFIELLQEDYSAFLDECGGIGGLVKSAKWRS